ncbi:unnamed protein product [Urochloa humidicola]
MDGNKRARGEKMKKKKPAAAPAGDDDAAATQLPAARKTPLPPDAAAPPADDGEPPVGIVEEEEVDDDEDDEQVERFYALLANIRAMRGMLSPPYASCAGGAADAGSRKRLRAAEPPWRPAFRMEDFEVEPPASAPPAPSSKKTNLTTTTDGGDDDDDHGKESASGGARPAVAVAPSLPPHAAVRSDKDLPPVAHVDQPRASTASLTFSSQRKKKREKQAKFGCGIPP